MWIVDGDHEEAVERSQQDNMAEWLPDAGLLLLPQVRRFTPLELRLVTLGRQVSHFAFIQDPDTFNAMLKRFFALP